MSELLRFRVYPLVEEVAAARSFEHASEWIAANGTAPRYAIRDCFSGAVYVETPAQAVERMQARVEPDSRKADPGRGGATTTFPLAEGSWASIGAQPGPSMIAVAAAGGGAGRAMIEAARDAEDREARERAARELARPHPAPKAELPSTKLRRRIVPRRGWW